MTDLTAAFVIAIVEREFAFTHEQASRVCDAEFRGEYDAPGEWSVDSENFFFWLVDTTQQFPFGVRDHRGKDGAGNGTTDPKNKGGAPATYDWDRIFAELVEMTVKREVPEVKAAFFRGLQARCKERNLGEPSERSLDMRFGRIYQILLDKGLAKPIFEKL